MAEVFHPGVQSTGAGVAPGDAVAASMVLDTEKRTVEPPPELKAVFAKNAAARAN